MKSRSYRAGTWPAPLQATGRSAPRGFQSNGAIISSTYGVGGLSSPDLKHKVISLAREHAPNRILIEKAGPGLHLIQQFRADPVPGVPVPNGVKPEGEKLVRMEAQCARFEAGQVYLPKEAPWLGEFMHEILAFPNGRHDDQIDSVSQFLNWAEALRDSDYAFTGTMVKVFVGGIEWTP